MLFLVSFLLLFIKFQQEPGGIYNKEPHGGSLSQHTPLCHHISPHLYRGLVTGGLVTTDGSREYIFLFSIVFKCYSVHPHMYSLP